MNFTLTAQRKQALGFLGFGRKAGSVSAGTGLVAVVDQTGLWSMTGRTGLQRLPSPAPSIRTEEGIRSSIDEASSKLSLLQPSDILRHAPPFP